MRLFIVFYCSSSSFVSSCSCSFSSSSSTTSPHGSTAFPLHHMLRYLPKSTDRPTDSDHPSINSKVLLT